LAVERAVRMSVHVGIHLGEQRERIGQRRSRRSGRGIHRRREELDGSDEARRRWSGVTESRRMHWN
jgi:hypothetical protein